MIAVSEISRELARDAVEGFLFWLAQKRKHQAKAAKPAKPKKFRQGSNTPVVIEWLKAQPEPQTVEQIGDATGIGQTTIREMIRQNREVFVHAGTIRNGRAGVKLWKVT